MRCAATSSAARISSPSITPDGGVFLRCFQNDCVSVEGGDRTLMLQWNKTLGWEAIPEEPKKPNESEVKVTQRFLRGNPKFAQETALLEKTM